MCLDNAAYSFGIPSLLGNCVISIKGFLTVSREDDLRSRIRQVYSRLDADHSNGLTLDEINVENREYFLEAGGTTFTYVKALNDKQSHVGLLSSLAKQHWSHARSHADVRASSVAASASSNANRSSSSVATRSTSLKAAAAIRVKK